jgi:maltose-binding protein MalE
MSELRIFSYLPNPRIWKETIAARLCGIEVEVRVKALSGTGGLLDSLVTTSAAAPQAMPDVVALSRVDLEAAALKGLLHTYSGPTDIQDGPDWYDYARQLAQIQNSVYGLPFAGDVGLLVYRPESIPVPPTDWSALLQNQAPFIFAAGDSDSIFTLTLYQARTGAIQDSQGQPYLEAAQLEEVLNFYAEARDR